MNTFAAQGVRSPADRAMTSRPAAFLMTREVKRALDNLVRDRTVIAVAHRLSTLCSFDRIIMLNEERIVEGDTPAELARSDGLFSSLWQMQAATLWSTARRLGKIDVQPAGAAHRSGGASA